MILKNVPKTDPMFQKIWRMTSGGGPADNGAIQPDGIR